MSDEITKPIEEPTPIASDPVVTEVPVVVEESVLVTNHSSLEPNSTTEPVTAEAPAPILITNNSPLEPNLITEPVVNEAPKDPVVEISSPEQIEAKPLSAPIDSEPSLVNNHSPLEPNPTSLITSPSPLEPNSRPYSLDPKLNKAIEAFVRGMNNSKENLILAQKAVKAKMMKKVYRIMDLFKKKQKIKNDDVEKFIHTSDKTATKYLNILTKEGKIKRQGKNNKTYYTKE